MKTKLIICCLFLMAIGLGSFNTAEKNLVRIKTPYGDMVVYLYDATPKHKVNFLKLVREKFYDSTTFHRIMKNFMIQGGDPNSKDKDPNNDGQGGPGYNIDAEINPHITHKYGALATARLGDEVNPQKQSSGSQFYIVVNKNGTHFLDNNYTVFGEVVSGMETAEIIVNCAANPGNNRPFKDIKMTMEMAKDAKVDLKDLQIR
jgi:cyclophilin family peptidyl-prolyl cis-trans isomerase